MWERWELPAAGVRCKLKIVARWVSSMANPKQLARLRNGVHEWNAWRKSAVECIDLSNSDLSETALRRANLAGADLTGANLFRADLSKANLKRANLSESVLTNADLSEANLSNANFTLASLGGANFTRATLGYTGFGIVNLRGTVGLETCRHGGPSIIDYTTLAKSGQLPIAFLQGCGLPHQVVSMLSALLSRSARHDSCFISYSNKDQDFAERLHADLQAKGVRCWFAPRNLAGGKKVHEQIDEAIRDHDRLLLILSEHSMRSGWVKTEIANARKKEQAQGRRVLFPIALVAYETIQPWKLFDADIGDDSAAELREYFMPDFSMWKEDDARYRQTFEKLLRDLQADPRVLVSAQSA